MRQEIISYNDFKQGYKSNRYRIAINPRIIPELVNSPLFSKSRKRVYKFHIYSNIAIIIIGLALFFYHWYVAMGILIFGYLFTKNVRSSATNMIRDNIIEDEAFFHFALSSKSVIAGNHQHSFMYKNGQLVEMFL